MNIIIYSGIGVNDLGNYEGCQYRTDATNYVLATVSVSGLQAYYSLCLPEECTYKVLQEIISGTDTAIPNLKNETRTLIPSLYGHNVGIIPTEDN